MTDKHHELEPIKAMANGRVVTDTDAALKAIHSGVPEMTLEDEKRLVRKIDLSIVPLMCMALMDAKLRRLVY